MITTILVLVSFVIFLPLLVYGFLSQVLKIF